MKNKTIGYHDSKYWYAKAYSENNHISQIDNIIENIQKLRGIWKNLNGM